MGQVLLLVSLMISMRILILNEEVLVLICFIIFILLFKNKVGSYVNGELINRSKNIFLELKVSYKDYNNQVSTIISFLTMGQKLSDQLNCLLHFNNHGISLLFNKLVSDICEFTQLFFLNRFNFVISLESEIVYLLRILLCLELDRIVKINCDLINPNFSLSFVILGNLVNHERIILV
nr:Ymf39 [Cyanidiaceae sp.]